MKTRNILVRFEVTDKVTDEILHEDLCTAIYEDVLVSNVVRNGTVDIEIQKLSIAEAIDLGVAITSFSSGLLDQGVHAVLPGIINAGEADEREENMVFKELCEQFLDIDASELVPEQVSQEYIDVVVAWAKDNNVELGR